MQRKLDEIKTKIEYREVSAPPWATRSASSSPARASSARSRELASRHFLWPFQAPPLVADEPLPQVPVKWSSSVKVKMKPPAVPLSPFHVPVTRLPSSVPLSEPLPLVAPSYVPVTRSPLCF